MASKIKFLSLLFLMSLFFIYPVNAQTINISTSADCYIDNYNADNNYGNSSIIYSFYSSGQQQHPFLKFNVPVYAQNAYLHIYTTGGYGSPRYINVYPCSNDWNESIITWNDNNPSYVEQYNSITTASTTTPGWQTINLSSYVKNPGNYSIWLKSDYAHYDYIRSKEYGSNAPYLEVEYQGSIPIANFTANTTSGNAPLTVFFSGTSIGNNINTWVWQWGDRTANGTSQNMSHTFTNAGTYQVSLTVSNEAGSNTTLANITVSQNTYSVTAIEDSYIRQDTPNTNYGSENSMLFRNSNGITAYSLLKFSTPVYASTATLHIYTDGVYPNIVDIYPCSNDWNETGITWNTGNPSYMPDNQQVTYLQRVDVSTSGWHTINLSSYVHYAGNYSVRFETPNSYYDTIETKESSNAPFIEVVQGTIPVDIIWNNKTNNDSNAFLVNTGDNIKFNITASNIANYTWYVNKTLQGSSTNSFNFTVPSFNVSRPYEGIWEIRVECNYTNSSKLIREWMVSGLTKEQAPAFFESFSDLNNTRRTSAYPLDPWGRSAPTYVVPTNYISNGYGTGMSWADSVLKTYDFHVQKGTYRYKMRFPSGATGQSNVGLEVYQQNGDDWGPWFCSNYDHDYFNFNIYSKMTSKSDPYPYMPISKRWLGQAPGVYYYRGDDNGWHTVDVIADDNGWWYEYIDGKLGIRQTGHYDNLFSDPVYLKILAEGNIQIDDVEVYDNKFIYPDTNITYGYYPKYISIYTIYTNWQDVFNAVTDDYGIIADGRGLSLKQISDTIKNNSLITYNNTTKTATLKTNLFLVAGSELNVTNETLIVDTSSKSLFIRPVQGCTLRIFNSTITTTSSNPLIWNFASYFAKNVFKPIESRYRSTYQNNPLGDTDQFYRGRFIVENSTIDNSCNMFLEGAHEVTINNTVFSNMSSSNYGLNEYSSDYEIDAQLHYDSEVGNRSLRIDPRLDLAKFSINNISFKNPKENINLDVVGGAWIFNTTTIENSDLSNIRIRDNNSIKYENYVHYNDKVEPSDLSLLNCKFNESNLTVRSGYSRIKTKYYTDVVVKDSLGNPIPNAIINISSSNSSYPAESLYKRDLYISDIYGPGKGGVSDYAPPDNRYYNYNGGYYKRWYNAQPLTSATTSAAGRTSLPTEDVKNSIVLIDKVLVNNGMQTSISLTYSMTVSAPGYYSSTMTNINPDSSWYTANLSNIHQLNVTLSRSGNITPIADFSADETTGIAPLSVKFTDNSLNDPTSWRWNFGDGGTSTSQNPTNTYTSAGTFTVILTATNNAGSNTNTKTGYITVTGQDIAPKAGFTSDKTAGVSPLTVNFTDTSTNTPTSWYWNFGDGQTSTSQNLTHTYSSAGIYTVSLTSINAAGSNTSLKTNYIFVINSSKYDVNKDGIIDLNDLNMISQNYGSIQKIPYLDCDVNQDGIINLKDLILVSRQIYSPL